MMSSPLFNSLPRVRLSCLLSPALPVAVIKSGHPESVSPPHDCSHVYFQQNEFSPSLPLLPDLYFGALDVPSCSSLSSTRCKCFPFIHISSPTPFPQHCSLPLSPNASGGLTRFSPPSELQEIPVATREQSGVLCFHSRWRPVSPGVSGMQPRDPYRPWRGTLASGHKPR